MCTWVGGADVTTGAAWGWAQGATHAAKGWCFTEERRADGRAVQCRGLGKEPSSPRTPSSLSDSLSHFHPHSTALILRHAGPTVVGPALHQPGLEAPSPPR